MREHMPSQLGGREGGKKSWKKIGIRQPKEAAATGPSISRAVFSKKNLGRKGPSEGEGPVQ